MKKILIAFSIFLGGFYFYPSAHAAGNKFVFSQHSSLMPEDTNKNASANTNGAATDTQTQKVMDSLNNPQGVYYGNFGNSDQPVHVEGMREPNSYKSGRTGGQYDPVIKPGSVPMKKKSDSDDSGK
jgi:hypothetical protein